MDAVAKFLTWLGKVLIDIGRAIGREEANAEANTEQLKRIAEAEAARADHDAFADGSVRDPRQRD